MNESPNLLKHQVEILANQLDILKKSHRELQRKYNSLNIWKLLRGRHK